MTLTDEELDRDWKPNGRRPQSTMARSFSAELMDIFRIENAVTDLDQQVDERRTNVGRNNQELASLEARIKEMEERLQQRGKQGPSRPALDKPQDGAASATASTQAQQHTTDQASGDQKARSRPGTARASRAAPSSGNMPPTPGASEDGDRD